jgi:hypothetical protein
MWPFKKKIKPIEVVVPESVKPPDNIIEDIFNGICVSSPYMLQGNG